MVTDESSPPASVAWSSSTTFRSTATWRRPCRGRCPAGARAFTA